MRRTTRTTSLGLALVVLLCALCQHPAFGIVNPHVQHRHHGLPARADAEFQQPPKSSARIPAARIVLQPRGGAGEKENGVDFGTEEVSGFFVFISYLVRIRPRFSAEQDAFDHIPVSCIHAK